MKTLANIEVAIDSNIYKVGWKSFPDSSAPERHVVVIGKSDRLVNILLDEFSNCEDIDCLKKAAEFYDDEAWLLLEVNGTNLFVINNSNLVLYHEQAGKTTCLTDPLFDFTHRLTWQDEDGSRVKTVSQAVINSDDVIRIEENGLRIGRIIVKYIEELYAEESLEEQVAVPVHVNRLRSKTGPYVLVALIALVIVGLVFGLHGSRFLVLSKPSENNVTETPTTSSTDITAGVLDMVKTATKAQLGSITGKWVSTSSTQWYVSDGSYIYSSYGKNAVGTSKGLFIGKLWYVDTVWYLQYSEGMMHLTSLKGNKISLTGTDKTDFDAVRDFTAFSSETTATAMVVKDNGVEVFSGQNYLAPVKTISYPSGYKLIGAIKRKPLTLLLGNGTDLRIMQVGNGVLTSVGTAEKADWAMISGNQVYTITGSVLHTQSVDFLLPFNSANIASVDGMDVLLKQPCQLLELRP